MEQAQQVTAVEPFKFQTIEELMMAPPETTRYVVDKLLPTAGTSILLAKPKTGKSTLARQIAVAVAKGQSVLGRETERGSVLYMALEEKRSEVLAHLQQLGAGKNDAIEVLFGAVNKARAVAQLDATLKQREDVKLVIVDPLFRFLQVEDSNDYVKVNDAIERINEIAKKYPSLHIMMLHHLKKRAEEDTKDQTLGSTALNAGVDTILMLTTDRTGSRMISSANAQRYGTPIQETYLAWNPQTRSMALGNSLEEAQEYSKKQKERSLQKDIIGYVQEHPACTQDAVITSVGGNRKKIIFTLKALVAEGKLAESGRGTKGDPHTYSTPVFTVPYAQSAQAVTQ
jgi:RecA-family ATPase